MMTSYKLPLVVLILSALSACAPSRPLFSSEPIDGAAVSPKTIHYIGEEGVSSKHASAPAVTSTSYSDCKQTKSAHNPVNFLPFIGPVFDYASLANSDKLLWWELPLSMALPIFGPSMVKTMGSQLCVR